MPSKLNKTLVGAGRFERPTPCAQGRCATRLRYAPTLIALLILNHLFDFRYCPACPNRVETPLRWQSRNKTPIGPLRVKTRSALSRLPVQLLQTLPFHLQLPLRVLPENFRIPSAKQLRDPLVRRAIRA
jgi:hypothetical protein